MIDPVFAQGTPSVFHDWADAASFWGFVLGLASLVITLAGFGFTLWGIWRIREATAGAVRRVGLQLAAHDLAALSRLAIAVRDANGQSRLERALFLCEEAADTANRVCNNPHLIAEDQTKLKKLAQDFSLIVRHILGEGQPAEPLVALSAFQVKRLSSAIAVLSDMNGRMQNAALEV